MITAPNNAINAESKKRRSFVAHFSLPVMASVATSRGIVDMSRPLTLSG